jgi:hypothetical protein
MKDNKTNKILVGVIAILTVVIVALAVVFIVMLINSTGKNNNTSDNTVQEKTAQRDTVEETTLQPVICNKGEYRTKEDIGKDVSEQAICSLTITESDENKISFDLCSVSSPPANRIADLSIKDLELTDGKGHFTFDNDGWFNRGEGDIEILSKDRIKLSVEITKYDSDAFYSLDIPECTMLYCGESSTSK